MDKKDLLKFCRYYKGEDDCPFKNSPQFYIWTIERDWISEMGLEDVVSDRMSSALNRYITAGYTDFEKFDNTPITLKAMLFMLIEKWNEGIVKKDTFADFYQKWLHKQI